MIEASSRTPETHRPFARSFRQHFLETVTLAVPVAIGQLGHVLLVLVDNLMVGSLGAVPLAGASLGHGVFVLMLVFAAGMASAITPLTAIAVGEDDHDLVSRIARQGLVQNFLLSLLLCGVTMLMANSLHLLGQDNAVVDEAVPYLRVMGVSFLPMLAFMSMRNVTEGLSFPKPAMLIILAANIINIFGNWVFIFGNLGMPRMGLVGAGYSSVLVEFFSAVALWMYIHRSRRFRRYLPLLRLRGFEWMLQRRMLRIGTPSGLQWLFEAGSFSFSTVMMGWISATALAAHQIGLSLAAISYMAILGISSAATIRVGNAMGRKHAEDLRRAGFTGIIMAICMMSIAAVVFIVFRSKLPELYIRDPAVIDIASTLLIVAAVFQLSDGVQAVTLGVLRGITDVTVPMFIAVFAYWFLGVPSGYLLAFVFGLGPVGIWIGFIIGLTVAALSFVRRFNRQCHSFARQWPAFTPSPQDS